MCGIVGFVRTSEKHINNLDNLMSDLLMFDSVRGDDSTGIMYVKREWNGGKKEHHSGSYKQALPGWDFIRTPGYKECMKFGSNLLFCVGHNRAATRGAVTTNNSHPFVREHIALVHNGSLRNHHSMTKELIQVDSEAIAECIQSKGLRHTVDAMEGAYSLVWHDRKENSLNFLRNEQRPMVVAMCDDLMVFGSEEGILRAACDRNRIKINEVYSTVPHSHIKLQLSLDKLSMVDIVEEEMKPAPKPQTYPARYNGYGYSWEDDVRDYHAPSTYTAPASSVTSVMEVLGVGCPAGTEINTAKYPINAVRPHLGVGQQIVFCLLDYSKKGAKEGRYLIDGEFMLLKHQHISIYGDAPIPVVHDALNNKKMVRATIKKIERMEHGGLMLIEVETVLVTQIDDPVYLASICGIVQENKDELGVPAVSVQ